MGFCRSHEASLMEDVIDEAARISREATGSRVGNEYTVDGLTYFYEVDRKDQPDNGTRGPIGVNVGQDRFKPAGRFHIDGAGKLVRAPKHLTRLLELHGEEARKRLREKRRRVA